MCEVLTNETRTLQPAWRVHAVGVRQRRRARLLPDRVSPEMLRALAPHVETDLTRPERLVLLDDEWALVRAGRHTAGDYLTLAAGYGREPSAACSRKSRGDSVHRRRPHTARHRATIAGLHRSLLRPMFDEVGFTATGGETDDRRSLRGALIGALGASVRIRT